MESPWLVSYLVWVTSQSVYVHLLARLSLSHLCIQMAGDLGYMASCCWLFAILFCFVSCLTTAWFCVIFQIVLLFFNRQNQDEKSNAWWGIAKKIAQNLSPHRGSPPFCKKVKHPPQYHGFQSTYFCLLNIIPGFCNLERVASSS